MWIPTIEHVFVYARSLLEELRAQLQASAPLPPAAASTALLTPGGAAASVGSCRSGAAAATLATASATLAGHGDARPCGLTVPGAAPDGPLEAAGGAAGAARPPRSVGRPAALPAGGAPHAHAPAAAACATPCHAGTPAADAEGAATGGVPAASAGPLRTYAGGGRSVRGSLGSSLGTSLSSGCSGLSAVDSRGTRSTGGGGTCGGGGGTGALSGPDSARRDCVHPPGTCASSGAMSRLDMGGAAGATGGLGVGGSALGVVGRLAITAPSTAYRSASGSGLLTGGGGDEDTIDGGGRGGSGCGRMRRDDDVLNGTCGGGSGGSSDDAEGIGASRGGGDGNVGSASAAAHDSPVDDVAAAGAEPEAADAEPAAAAPADRSSGSADDDDTVRSLQARVASLTAPSATAGSGGHAPAAATVAAAGAATPAGADAAGCGGGRTDDLTMRLLQARMVLMSAGGSGAKAPTAAASSGGGGGGAAGIRRFGFKSKALRITRTPAGGDGDLPNHAGGGNNGGSRSGSGAGLASAFTAAMTPGRSCSPVRELAAADGGDAAAVARKRSRSDNGSEVAPADGEAGAKRRPPVLLPCPAHACCVAAEQAPAHEAASVGQLADGSDGATLATGSGGGVGMPDSGCTGSAASPSSPEPHNLQQLSQAALVDQGACQSTTGADVTGGLVALLAQRAAGAAEGLPIRRDTALPQTQRNALGDDAGATDQQVTGGQRDHLRPTPVADARSAMAATATAVASACAQGQLGSLATAVDENAAVLRGGGNAAAAAS
eukprot:17933-Chlamydomonas_euryale.AAC.10